MIRRSKAGGFGLVEALVAVALASVALLLGMSLLAQVSPTVQRLLTHQTVLAMMVSSLEMLRGGYYDCAAAITELPSPGAIEDFSLRMIIEGEPGYSDLNHVTIKANYSVRGHPYQRTLESLAWCAP